MLARVVEFEGVSQDRLDEMQREMQGTEPPEGLKAKEIVVLYDAGSEKALVTLFFDSEEDYQSSDAVLNEMPADETPGRRASVTKYAVALRQSM